MKNRKELNTSLKGTTLGDADGDTEDALKWIKKAKRREKELAKKRQEEMDSMDKAVQDEYSESGLQIVWAESWPFADMYRSVEDLVGLKVSHDFEEMDEGDARILTLKDSRILDNEGIMHAPYI